MYYYSISFIDKNKIINIRVQGVPKTNYNKTSENKSFPSDTSQCSKISS